MAFQQFIKGSFNGKVGSVVGQKWKNKTQLHARVFSKSPPTEKQTMNVRAFECLNRLSSAVAKAWFPWLGLSDKGMYRHNAVARWLKPLIESHVFSPEIIQRIVEKDGQAVLESFNYDRVSGHFQCVAATQISPSEGRNESWLVTVLDSEGNVYVCESPKQKRIEIERYIHIPKSRSLCAFTMVSKKVGGRVKLSGLFYDELPPQYDVELIVESVVIDEESKKVVVTGHAKEETIDFETSLRVIGNGWADLKHNPFEVQSSLSVHEDGTFTQVFDIPTNSYGDRYYFAKGNTNTVPQTQIVKGKAVIVVKMYRFNVPEGDKSYVYRGALPSFVRSGATFTAKDTGWRFDSFARACNVRYDRISMDGNAVGTNAGMTYSITAGGATLSLPVSSDCRGSGTFGTWDDSMLGVYVEGDNGRAVCEIETPERRLKFPYWDNPLDFTLGNSNMSTSVMLGSNARIWQPDVYKGKLYWRSIASAVCNFMTASWGGTGYSLGTSLNYPAEVKTLGVVGGGQYPPAHGALKNVKFAANKSTSYVNAVASNGVTVRLRFVVGSSAVTWTVK